MGKRGRGEHPNDPGGQHYRRRPGPAAAGQLLRPRAQRPGCRPRQSPEGDHRGPGPAPGQRLGRRPRHEHAAGQVPRHRADAPHPEQPAGADGPAKEGGHGEQGHGQPAVPEEDQPGPRRWRPRRAAAPRGIPGRPGSSLRRRPPGRRSPTPDGGSEKPATGSAAGPDGAGGQQGEGDDRQHHHHRRAPQPLLPGLEHVAEAGEHPVGEAGAQALQALVVGRPQPGRAAGLVAEQLLVAHRPAPPGRRSAAPRWRAGRAGSTASRPGSANRGNRPRKGPARLSARPERKASGTAQARVIGL